MLDSNGPNSNQRKWFPNLAVLFRKPASNPEVKESLTAQQMEEFRQRVIRAHAATSEIAEELTLTLGLAQRIRTGNCPIESAYSRINFVFDCLLSNPSKLVEARGERLQLQFDAYRHSGGLTKVLAVLSAGNPTGVLIIALLASFAFWTVVAVGIRWIVSLDEGIGKELGKNIFFMNGRALAAISSAAFIGGVISIAIRLREFSQARDLDPFGLFLTVMFKPLIGVVLSWFLFATLAGEVIGIGFLDKNTFALEPIPDKAMYVLWILGFLAGFSERFAWDFVDRAEGIVVGGFAASGPSSDKSTTPRTTTDAVRQQSTFRRKPIKKGRRKGQQ
jgi:hypothetical protein